MVGANRPNPPRTPSIDVDRRCWQLLDAGESQLWSPMHLVWSHSELIRVVQGHSISIKIILVQATPFLSIESAVVSSKKRTF